MNNILEWLNLNTYRRYPLVDNCNYNIQGDGYAGLFRDATLLDFKYTSYVYSNFNVYLTGFNVLVPSSGPRIFRVIFKLEKEGVSDEHQFDIPENAAFPYRAVLFSENQHHVTAHFGAGCAILTGELATGSYTFVEPARVLPSLLVSQKDNRVNLLSGAEEGSIAHTGDIFLEEGTGIDVFTDPNLNVLYVRATPGGGTGFSCETVDGTRRPGQYIKTVNGLAPQVNGNIDLQSGRGFDIIPDKEQNTVVIKTTLRLDEILCGGKT